MIFLHHTVTKNVEGFGIRFNTTIRDNTLIRPHLYKESCSYRGLLCSNLGCEHGGPQWDTCDYCRQQETMMW